MARTQSKKVSYLNELFGRENALHKVIRANQSDDVVRMQIEPYEGKMLYMLLKLIGAQKVVELGMLAGYSTAWIAESLPENGKVYTFERDGKAVAEFQKKLTDFPEISKKIEIIEGDARERLLQFNEQIDAIFIDADKTSYPFYLEQANRLLREGGLIIADNVFLWGNVYDEPYKDAKSQMIQAMKDFNEMLAKSGNYESVLIPSDEGMLVAQKIRQKSFGI